MASAGGEPRGLEALAAEVLRRPPRLGGTRLVCVDGPSGSGKTVLANRLANTFVPLAPVVHTDDLLAGWDDQLTFWQRLERLVLAPLRAGRAGRYRAYDWRKGAFTDPEIPVPAAPVVIVEGVSAARAAARSEASLAVFVVAPLELRVARSAVRDGEEQRPYLDNWRLREERHFAADATAAHADLVIEVDASGRQRWLPRNPYRRTAGGTAQAGLAETRCPSRRRRSPAAARSDRQPDDDAGGRHL